ncbi:MAG: hypothetical protein ACUVSM_01175 [Armatimonadota bacterium]
MPTLGIEEEVFVTEPARPTLRSLYYLARLLARNPRFYYVHSASNFARFKDVRWGLMGGVEISTGVHSDPDCLLEDLRLRRRDLASVADGLIVPMGHLLEQDTPTNVCGLQVHLGELPDKDRAYRNIVHFLPLLLLLTANSPAVSGRRVGKSCRVLNSFAIGPLRPDRSYRFQDVIYSRRLGTLEVRVPDPVWDLERVRWLVRCLVAVATLERDLPFDLHLYNEQRILAARDGHNAHTRDLYRELREILDVPEELFERTPSDEIWEIYQRQGAVAAYREADRGYRGLDSAEEGDVRRRAPALAFAALAGFVGYFLPRLPYYAWKGLIE